MANQLTIRSAGLSQSTIQALIEAATEAHPGEGHIGIPAPFYNTVVQGTFVIQIDTTNFYNGQLTSTSAASGDSITYQAFLAKGTYTLKLLSNKYSNRGIMKILIGATQVAAFDLYSSGFVNNVFFTQTDIVIATSGLKTITILTNTKNAASSAYMLSIIHMAFYRTA